MPDSSRVALPEGGKLAGMRTIVVRMPRFSSTSQKGCPWRSSSTLSAPSGIWYLPSVSFLSEASARLVEACGAHVTGYAFLVELVQLEGRAQLAATPSAHVAALLRY